MTEKIKWDDNYLVGIPTIDEQHKELVSIINELYDATQQDEEMYRLKSPAIFEKLKNYTMYHFGEEEKLMKKYGSAIIDLHTMQHTAFINDVAKEIEKLADSKPEDGLKFYHYLLTWLVSHIAGADKVWAVFVLSKMHQEELTS